METDAGWIETFSGERIRLNTQGMNAYLIEDIAHALAVTCRFGGHSRWHYSVAQHSIYVATLVPEAYRDYALLHDAAEAYMCDLPRPVKALIPEYKWLENKLLIDIFHFFGLGDTVPNCVKRADDAILVTEARALMKSRGEGWEFYHEPAKKVIPKWPVVTAKHGYLAWADKYLKKRG